MDVIQHGYTPLGLQFGIARKPIPHIDEDQVLILIHATSVTRFDLFRQWSTSWDKITDQVRVMIQALDQLFGTEQDLNEQLGMECSGIIAQVGSKVTRFNVGDKVCALLMGGGYAEFVAVDSHQVFPIPVGLSVVDAASLPYDACFVWYSLFMRGELREGCTIMIHGGCKEYGPLAIKLAKSKNCTIFTTTCGTDETEYCKALGAHYCLHYCFNFEKLVKYVLDNTNGTGVDFVFDAAGNRVSHNIKILAKQGTLVFSAHGSTSRTDVWDFKAIAFKQVKLIAVSYPLLKPATRDEIIKDMTEKLWPLLPQLNVGAGIYRVYKFKDVFIAHHAMKNNMNKGKILLTPLPGLADVEPIDENTKFLIICFPIVCLFCIALLVIDKFI